MRIGLISAMIRTPEGGLRADLALAGRSVLHWQADVLRMLGAERILCLAETADTGVLALQHEVEAAGIAFHAVRHGAAIAALVRAEDDLVCIRDGLIPDPAVLKSLLTEGEQLRRLIATIPADHPLVEGRPQDFERIDATRHWAGVLVMRGAPVQALGDFPADADPVSVLLRLALQAGTPCREVDRECLTPEFWLLAENAEAIARAEAGLIDKAASPTDWRTPLTSLAGWIVRKVAPRGLASGATFAGFAAGALMAGGVVLAALGMGAAGLLMSSIGAFAGSLASAFGNLAERLRPMAGKPAGERVRGLLLDGLAALAIGLALAGGLEWNALAACGPLIIGLARLAAREAVAALSNDRAALLLALAVAATTGLLAELVVCLAMGLLAALLLHRRGD